MILALGSSDEEEPVVPESGTRGNVVTFARGEGFRTVEMTEDGSVPVKENLVEVADVIRLVAEDKFDEFLWDKELSRGDEEEDVENSEDRMDGVNS